MNPNRNLTKAERGVLDQARRLLGDHLASLLLSGLGHADITHCRAFTAQGSSPDNEGVTYRFEMHNDSAQGLPNGRDPLVLAALLNLLWERQPLDGSILFRESDILDKLEWTNNAEAQRIIRRALERYVLTAYCLIDPTVAEEERPLGRYTSIGRLLIGYEMAALQRPTDRVGHLRFATRQPGFRRAQFLPVLIHDVISERKYFLGIEFQRLQEMQEILL